MKARWRRRFPPRLPEWTEQIDDTSLVPLVVTQLPNRIQLTGKSVGWLLRQVSTRDLRENVRDVELVVDDWRPPWPNWSGRLGPLPGLVRYEVRLPERGHGRASVRVGLAVPARLDRIVAAMLPVLEPWLPLPAPIRPDVTDDGATPGWLWTQTKQGPPPGAASTGKNIPPYDVRLVPPDAPDSTADAEFATSRYGVVSAGGATGVVVDAATANPRGRHRYGADLPVGRLRLVGEADAPWWQVTRPGDESKILVAGAVGEALDERQRAAIARLGAAVMAEVSDVPPIAVAATLAQLAMTGLILHAPQLADSVAAPLAADLVALLRTPLPGKDADALDWEMRGVGQRRSAMRHHATAFTWPRTLADVYPALGSPPAVTALLVTRRPRHVGNAVAALAAQSYPALEIVVGLHGCDLSAAERDRLVRCDVPVRVVSIPGQLNLGEALAHATRLAQGSLVTKVDDDDRYGPEHIWDLVLARHYSGATVVGKGAEFVYLESRDLTVRRYMGSEFYTDVVAGGTMLLSRGDLEDVGGWRPLPMSVDRGLLNRVLDAGGLVYRTHGLGFVYTRHEHGHTWDPGQQYFFYDPRAAWRGLPPYREFGVR